MNQLNREELKYVCIQCKQVVKDKYCWACHSKNNKKKFRRYFECKQINTENDWCKTYKRFKENFNNRTNVMMILISSFKIVF